MTSTSATSTNRLLEVLQGFSDRRSQKRTRTQAIDHFVSCTPTLLSTSSVQIPTFRSKRTKQQTDNKDSQSSRDSQLQRKIPLLVDDLVQADIQRCQDDLQRQDHELSQMEDTKQQVLQEIIDVWGVYKYGLTKIAALTELSEAPDAIMPGNF